MLLEAILALVVGGVVYWAVSLHLKHRRYSHIPGPPRDSFVFGHFARFRRRVKEDGVIGWYFTDLYHEYGEVFLIWFGSVPIFVILNPSMIKEVLTDYKTFKKPPVGSASGSKIASLMHINGHRFCGVNSVLTDIGGPVWEHKKRIMDPAFSHKILSEHSPKFYKVAERMVDHFWKKQKEDGNVELREAISPFTLDALISAGFSGTVEDSKAAENKLYGVGQLFERVFKSTPLQSMFPRLSGLSKFAEEVGLAIDDVREIGKQMILARTSAGEFGSVNDILDHIIAANYNKESGELDVEGCLDDFMAMYGAGQATTLATMGWTISELVRHADIMERLVEEIDEVWVAGGINDESDSATISKAVRDMKYLDAVVKEVLRHHPPVTVALRTSDKAANIAGYKIPAWTRIMTSQQTMQHLPKYWEEPERFNPNRFIDNSPVPFTYFPFFMGPRSCMGKNFAVLELKVLLCVTLARFTVVKDPSTPEKITSMQAVLCYSTNNLVRISRR